MTFDWRWSEKAEEYLNPFEVLPWTSPPPLPPFHALESDEPILSEAVHCLPKEGRPALSSRTQTCCAALVVQGDRRRRHHDDHHDQEDQGGGREGAIGQVAGGRGGFPS